MVIKVLGSGCANCVKLERNAQEAARRAGVEADIVKVTEMPEIMAYGIMTTPGLVVDEQLKVAGRVPAVEEIVSILASAG